MTDTIPPTKIPLRGGDEFDALTRGGKRHHNFRAGERSAAKRSYTRRCRRVATRITRGISTDAE